MIKKSTGAPRVYFIGIGGIGMSALARYLKAQGYVVTGSDSTGSNITDSLRKDAIKVKIGHRKGNIAPNTDFVVYNRAIRENNPELLAARKLGVPILPYATVLGKLTEAFSTIAITGSHGKSTTTALAGLLLVRGGLDPTVLIGTNLKEFAGKNIRIGKNAKDGLRYLVLEADDFGAAFLAYSPFISIVTNIDREHMDFYKTFTNVKRAFLKFMARTREGGVLILNRDDATLNSLRSKIAVTAKIRGLRVIWYSTRNSIAARHIKKILKIPGEHNLSNAMAIYELGRLLKVNEKKIFAALGAYQGAWRRMEYRGKTRFGKIFDDYAHHPTEIKATLQAFREKFPHARIICVFQPHQTKRLQALFKEFTAAFSEADSVVLIPSYAVAGRDISNPKFTSERLTIAIQKKYPDKQISYLDNPKNIKKILDKIATPQSIVIMMGAGDIVNHTASLMVEYTHVRRLQRPQRLQRSVWLPD